MEMPVTQRMGIILIGVITLVAMLAIFTLDPILQDSAYHRFSDARELWGIPNFWNVCSNLAFLLVGILGTHQLTNGVINSRLQELHLAYIALFVGVALVSLGSIYYHLNPDNQTLLWDRLPMTIAFMSLFTIIIGEFASVRLAKQCFIPLILAGLGSVVYWYIGELNGAGDLRIYILVQFLPVFLIPIFLLLFRSRFDRVYAYWWLLLSYVIAKILEYFDAEIFELSGFISGHSLKHLVAAMGLYLLLDSYRRRNFSSGPG